MDGAPGRLRIARERQKQIPFGDDNKKATARWLVDGLRPTHRKGRDGWAHRRLRMGKRTAKQIAFGDDNKKATAWSGGFADLDFNFAGGVPLELWTTARFGYALEQQFFDDDGCGADNEGNQLAEDSGLDENAVDEHEDRPDGQEP